ncbi:FRG domain-containing protein [Roseateles sp.]|uniref:FRG domain-containing protein n=1 Tax=Roseateles sp. TaxID=1971397 RepID=UPI003264E438
MRQTAIESFVSFVQATDVFDLLVDLVVFRGQATQGNLLPSVARADQTMDTTEHERSVLEQLRLQGASFLSGVEPNDLDLLVLAQHFGLKTRLLDWTGNPLVALWFACADKAEGDVYVYALEADSLLTKDVYKQDPFSRAATKVFQPRLNNSRIVAQQGWFTLHRYAEKNKTFVALEKNPKIKEHLHEYHVPAKYRQVLLAALDRHGISAKTIYPDLAGLCQHLNWKHRL